MKRARGLAGMIKRCMLFVCCVMLVSACASKKAPAIREPESRQKAFQKPYSVMGQRYEPLRTHEGFMQTGIASWYGKDFHGKKTSNGEIYDMHAMTAAHKTLPLGVFVRVKNLDNGREAVVRVNDRGPFVKGRIIDLSYSAAKGLGVDIAGTAPVRVVALGYRGNGADQYQVLDNYDAGNYRIQVGSFREVNNAQRLAGEVKRLTGFSEVRRAQVGGETFYRVYAGKYSSLKAAEKAERELCDHGYPGSFTVARE